AFTYLAGLDRAAVAAHEEALLTEATARLAVFPRVRLIGRARARVGIVSFVLDGVHPHDIGTIADRHGVAIRTGHHCAQPLLARFGAPATARLSLALYNTRADVDALLTALREVTELFP